MKIEFEGRRLELPDDVTQEEFDSIIKSISGETPVSAEPQERTDDRDLWQQTGDLLNETGATAIQSLGTLGSVMNPGNQGTIRAGADSAAEALRSYQSTYAQDERKDLSAQQAQAEQDDPGLFSGLDSWVDYAKKNPGLAIAAPVAGSMALPVGAGKLAARAAGKVAGTAATALTGAGLGAGQVRQGYYDSIVKLSDDQLLAENDAYRVLRENLPEKEAKEVLGQQVDSRLAVGMTVSAALGAVASVFGAEGAMVGGAKKGLGAMLGTTAKEAGFESTENVTQTLAQQSATKEAVPSTIIGQGAGTQAVQGLIMGTAGGAGGHMLSPSKDTNEADAPSSPPKAPETNKGLGDALDNLEKGIKKDKANKPLSKVNKVKKAKIPLDPYADPSANDTTMVEVDTESDAYKRYEAQQKLEAARPKLTEKTPGQAGSTTSSPNNPGGSGQGPANDPSANEQYQPQGTVAPGGIPQDTSVNGKEMLQLSGQDTEAANDVVDVDMGPDTFSALPSPFQEELDSIQSAPEPATAEDISVLDSVTPSPPVLTEDPNSPDYFPEDPLYLEDHDKLMAEISETGKGKSAQSVFKIRGDVFDILSKRSANASYRFIAGRLHALREAMHASGWQTQEIAENIVTNSKGQNMAHNLGLQTTGRGTSTISISNNAFRYAQNGTGGAQSILLHEGIHQTIEGLRYMYRDPKWRKDNPGLAKKFKELDSLFTNTKNELKKKGAVSESTLNRLMENPGEFIAYGMTDLGFIDILRKMPRAKSNAFVEFLRAVGKVLGFRDGDYNAYGELVGIFEGIAKDKGLEKGYKDTIDALTKGKPLSPATAYARITGIEEYGSVDSPDDVRKAWEDGEPDVKRSVVGQYLRSGIRHLAIATGNTWVQYAHTITDRAISFKNDKLKAVLGKDKNSLVSIYARMDAKDKNDLRIILQRQDRNQVYYPVNQIPGISNDVRAYLVNKKAQDDAVLTYGNQELKKLGKQEIKPRDGYTNATFSGVFRALVTVKDRPIGYVGENTRGDYNKALAWIKNNHPNAKITGLPNKGSLKGSRSSRDVNELEKLVQLHYPGINADILEAARLMDDRMFNMDKRKKKKLGIWGAEGNKPWQDSKTNDKQFFKAQFDYFDEAWTHHALLGPLDELRTLRNEAGDRQPNANEEITSYIKHMTGENLNGVGEGINRIIDSVMQGAGYSTEFTDPAVSEIRNHLTMMALGWFNVQYIAAQLMQPLQTASPFATQIKQRMRITPTQVSTALGNSTKALTAYLMSAQVDPITRQIFDFAEANGLTGQSHLEHRGRINAGKVSKTINMIGQAPMTIGDSATRFPMFLMFTNMLMNSNEGKKVSIEDILDSAKNITQFSMVDYSPAQRPQVYTKLGALGSGQGTYRTYLHGNVGQMKVLGQRAIKGKEKLPAMQMAGIMLAMSGFLGIPLMGETDMVLNKISELSGKPIETPSAFLLKHLPLWMSIGPMSEALGYDVQSKYAMNSIIPTNIFGAHVEQLWKPLMSAWELLSTKLKGDEITKQQWVNMGATVVPGSFRQQYNTTFNISPEGYVANKKTRFVDPIDQLSTDEMNKRSSPLGMILGAKPATESMRQKQDWINVQKNLSDTEALRNISANFKQMLAAGTLTEAKTSAMVSKMIERGATAKDIDSMIKRGITDVLEGQERIRILQGVEKGEINGRKLRALDNKYRK